jgi:hypothetical protein
MTMTKMAKFKKVSDSFTINRYDNGWMVEFNGRNENEDWVNAKVVCTTETDLINLIKEYNKTELDQ